MALKNEIVLIKFGGEIVDSLEQLENLAISVKELINTKKVILVHGGGPYATKLSEKLGIIPNIVGGRRVTCSETLEVMKMSLPGVINSNILSKLKEHSINSTCVSGISIVHASKRPPKAVSGSNEKLIDFGFVGDIHNIDTNLISILLDNDIVPVISPLSADKNGTILNINADTVAVQIASKIKASTFILVTKIGGVYKNVDDPNSRYTKLNINEIQKEINAGSIKGGMIPKLEEGIKLLKNDLSHFHIVNLDSNTNISKEMKNPGTIGTVIIK